MPKNKRKIVFGGKARQIALSTDKALSVRELATSVAACEPAGTSGAYRFKWRYLRESILEKYNGVESDGLSKEERVKAAYEKMLAAEETCKRVNDEGLSVAYGVLEHAREYIRKVIGTEPSYAMFEFASFSSGASTSRKKIQGDPWFKYTSNTQKPLHVTPAGYKYAYALIRQTPLWHQNGGALNITQVMGNHITTVDKSSVIDRPIAKEPDLNMALQRAVGSYFREQLKTVVGIDLNDQSINQRLARVGSEFRSLSTIDLSSASDLISQRIVWELLPSAWHDLLDDLRSKFGQLPNENGKTSWIYWEKFSSMGNGFTFELETLLFAALAYACSKQCNEPLSAQINFHVYGDDIIVPTRTAMYLLPVLEQCGFTPNYKKTFTHGPFRESCGKHYFDGIDVTPFYIKKDINTLPRVIWFLNRLRLWSYDEHMGVCDPSTYQLWLAIRRKFVNDQLLGGRQQASITSVMSPELPRKRLKFVTETKRIGGWRALLRQFNGQTKMRQTSFGVNEVLVRDLYDFVPIYTSIQSTGNSLVDSLIRAEKLSTWDLPPSGKCVVDGLTTIDLTLTRLSVNDDEWEDVLLYSNEYR